jgi:hypothetical protein
MGTGIAKITGMNSIPPVVFLVAALLCSLVGRLMLVRAAWKISVGWGLTVLAVPFGPFFFRLNHKELAQAGGYWRLATVPLIACFFLAGGSDSFSELDDLKFWEKKPALAASEDGKPALEDPEELDNAENIVAAAKAGKLAPGATLEIAQLTPPLPIPMTLAERAAANQREFTRLEEVYESLKRERGYLKKGDQAAVAEYNTAAAKYQAALAKARAEQTELMKLVAKK